MKRAKKGDHVVVHEHAWERAFTRADKFVGERCKCGAERERPATKAEKGEFKLVWARGKAIHALWHCVSKRFKKGPKEWKEQGWDLIENLEAFAAKHPEIRMARVDDSSFSNSELVFVPHSYDSKKLGCAYMGTTAVFVSQCAGDPPVEFFMYPGHLRNVIKTLQDIEKVQNAFIAKARKQGARFP